MKDKNCDKQTTKKRETIKGSDAIIEHEESWYRDREHWSEVHGWN